MTAASHQPPPSSGHEAEIHIFASNSQRRHVCDSRIFWWWCFSMIVSIPFAGHHPDNVSGPKLERRRTRKSEHTGNVSNCLLQHMPSALSNLSKHEICSAHRHRGCMCMQCVLLRQTALCWRVNRIERGEWWGSMNICSFHWDLYLSANMIFRGANGRILARLWKLPYEIHMRDAAGWAWTQNIV